MTDLLLQLKTDKLAISQLLLNFEELDTSVKTYNKLIQTDNTTAQIYLSNDIGQIITTLKSNCCLCDIFKLIQYAIKYKELLKEPEVAETCDVI